MKKKICLLCFIVSINLCAMRGLEYELAKRELGDYISRVRCDDSVEGPSQVESFARGLCTHTHRLKGHKLIKKIEPLDTYLMMGKPF